MPLIEEKKMCRSCDHVERVHDEGGCVASDDLGDPCRCTKFLAPQPYLGLAPVPRNVPQNRFKDVGNGNWQVLDPRGQVVRTFNDGGHQVGVRDLGD